MMPSVPISPMLQGHVHDFFRIMSANCGNAQITRMLANQARSIYTLTQPIAGQIIRNPATAKAIVDVAVNHGVRITLAALLADALPFLIIAAVVLGIVYWEKKEREKNLRRSGKTAELQNLQMGYENFMNNSPLSPVVILKTGNVPPELAHLM